MLGHRTEICHNLLEGEEIHWTPGPGFLPVPLLPPGLGTCCSPCWEHSFPHTPFTWLMSPCPSNRSLTAMSSRTLALTIQRRLNTTHLTWNSHHIYPIYSTSYLFSLPQYEVHEKKHFALYFHAYFPSKQAKNKR